MNFSFFTALCAPPCWYYHQKQQQLISGGSTIHLALKGRYFLAMGEALGLQLVATLPSPEGAKYIFLQQQKQFLVDLWCRLFFLILFIKRSAIPPLQGFGGADLFVHRASPYAKLCCPFRAGASCGCDLKAESFNNPSSSAFFPFVQRVSIL